MSVQTGRQCPSCGEALPDGAEFCASCGAGVIQAGREPVETRASGKATMSLVFGILGVIVLPMVFSLLAVAFGIIAKREVRQNHEMSGNGRATAGIVLGIAGLALLPVWLAYILET
ncbi:MAG: hypothetical protein QOJ13_2651 [Gaiellales bacterium]|jgi:predicted nucleic acid-binding Zn ribbon protein|nr:hypothetical protein [Gaiellales bacterium]